MIGVRPERSLVQRARRASAFVSSTVACLVGAALVVSPLAAAAQPANEERLSEARAQLQRIADELEEAESDVESRVDSLADAEERLAEIEEVVNGVAHQVERQRAAVGDAERELDELETQAADLAAQFEERIARLYMQGPDLTLEAFLSSTGAEEAIARTSFLERVTQGDQVDLERLEAATVRVGAQRERLAAEEERLAELLEEQQALLAQAEELRSSRALAAANARARAEELAEEKDDLEEEQAEIEELIRQHEAEQREEARRREEARQQAEEREEAEQRRRARERAEAEQREQARQSERKRQTAPPSSPSPPSSSTRSGGFAWPICAPVTSEYGPRWGRTHRGIDFGASTGSPSRAARAGTVITAGWQGGYGNLVLIDHHNGIVTAYAHLSRVAVSSGSSVSQGQTIGSVGSTGNSTGPHLHFEIRVNGSAVNPRQYLSGSPC